MILKTESLDQAWALVAFMLPINRSNLAVSDQNLNCRIYYAAGRYQDRVEVFENYLDVYKDGKFYAKIAYAS